MTAANLTALVVLVPLFGYTGAGMAVLLTAAAGLGAAVIAARRVFPLSIPWRDCVRVAGALAVMVAALAPLLGLRGPEALVAQLAAGALGYLAGALALDLLKLRSRAMASAARMRRRSGGGLSPGGGPPPSRAVSP
jgi:O-antigen/teichoic acid export membrane protein